MNELTPPGRLRRALTFVKPYRWWIAGILTLTLAVGGLNAIEPLILKSVFDALGSGPITKKGGPLGTAIVYLVGIGLLRELLSGLSNWLTWRTRLRVHYGLLDATVERLQLLPVSFHRKAGVGAVMTKLDRGIQGFVAAITELSFSVLPAVVYLVVSIVVMIKLDWRLALVALAFAPLPALVTALAAPTQMRRERTLLDRWAKIYSRFNEVLSGIITVKSFAMEEKEKQRFLRDVNRANDVVSRGVGFDSGVMAGQNLVVALARIAALVVGAVLVQKGDITAGTLVAFLGYVSGMFGPVQGLSTSYKTLRTASVSLQAIFEILDAQDHLGDADDARDPGHLSGRVAFEGVRFSYGRAHAPILDGIDLTVEPGEMIAVVGPSGSGKSTMMALLQRFYDPVEGVVRIDGQDLRTLKQRAVRSHIGVVLQDALLFNETVRDNIAYGRPEASLEAIEEAARAANAHEFVMRLDEGYDTVVGERGNRLSAGERQRIAIARALLKDPRILILDEATSALDAETEALVQEALDRLIVGRTTFVVAHRLSTVVKADRILVLRHGRVSEMGTHKELMVKDGYYAQLVRRQVQGLTDLEEAAA